MRKVEQGLRGFDLQDMLLDTLQSKVKTFLFDCQSGGYSKQTLTGYRIKLNEFLLFLDSIKISKPTDLKSDHVRLFFLARQQAGNNPTTINNFYRIIHRLCGWMVEQKIIERSPLENMKPPKKLKGMITPFRKEHIDTLLLQCGDDFLGTRNKAIILVFIDTGLRLSEMASVGLKDIEIQTGTIKVWGKGAKQRVVRIGVNTQKSLMVYLQQRANRFHTILPELWVTEEGKPLNSWGIQIMIRRLGKKAGFNDVRCSPHTFRHTFGTMALRNGGSVFEVQSLLGHSTLEMTRRYSATIQSEDAVKSHKKFSPVDNL